MSSTTERPNPSIVDRMKKLYAELQEELREKQLEIDRLQQEVDELQEAQDREERPSQAQEHSSQPPAVPSRRPRLQAKKVPVRQRTRQRKRSSPGDASADQRGAADWNITGDRGPPEAEFS